MLFDVRVLSFDPQATEDPVDALMRVFKVERAVARELVSRLPRVIKRAVPLETAQRFCEVLDRLGAKTEIVMSAGAPRGDDDPRAAARAPVTGTRPGAAPARSQPGLPAPGAGLPAPRAPANANGTTPHRASATALAEAALLRSGASSAFSLPDPTTESLALLPPVRPDPSRPVRTEALGTPRPRPGLPEPREPDPLEADIDSFVDRAFVEAVTPSPSPRRGHPAPDPEDSRIARGALPSHDTPPLAGRAAVVPEPAPVAKATPAEPAGNRRPSFRPARPAPDLSHAKEAARRPSETLFGRAEVEPEVIDLPRFSVPEPARTGRDPAPGVFGGGEPGALAASALAPAPGPALASAPAVEGPGGPPLPAPVAVPLTAGAAPLAPAAERRPLSLGDLAVHGPPVDRRRAALPGAAALERNVRLASGLMVLALSVITFGLLPLVLLALAARDSLARFRRVRAMHGSALPVGSTQLAELYGWLKQFAGRLELSPAPRLFVGRAPGVEIDAVPYRGELYVLVDGEALARHLAQGSGHALSFLLAHELGRHALGQRARLRSALSALWPVLRRMDVLSADALAAELLNDRALAQRALRALLVGPALAAQLDAADLDRHLASDERASAVYAPPLDGGAGLLLSRLYHMQTGYQQVGARPSVAG